MDACRIPASYNLAPLKLNVIDSFCQSVMAAYACTIYLQKTNRSLFLYFYVLCRFEPSKCSLSAFHPYVCQGEKRSPCLPVVISNISSLRPCFKKITDDPMFLISLNNVASQDSRLAVTKHCLIIWSKESDRSNRLIKWFTQLSSAFAVDNCGQTDTKSKFAQQSFDSSLLFLGIFLGTETPTSMKGTSHSYDLKIKKGRALSSAKKKRCVLPHL